MKLTNEQIQQILAGVPDEFTHVVLEDDDYEVYGEGTHNLSDLREILELRQEVARLKAQQSEVAARAVERAINNMLHKVANSYEGDDIKNPWCVGANHVFKLFALEREVIFKQLQEQDDEGFKSLSILL